MASFGRRFVFGSFSVSEFVFASDPLQSVFFAASGGNYFRIPFSQHLLNVASVGSSVFGSF